MREDIFIPEHRTNVLPLRWLANSVFHTLSMFFFSKGLRVSDKYQDYEHFTVPSAYDDLIIKTCFFVYHSLDKVYRKFGTTYMLKEGAAAQFLKDTEGHGWNDYDQNGIAYWQYDWEEDFSTGDAWRMIRKK